MTDFELVLEECLDDLEQGASNVDACLARHPEHAAQLGPILFTAERFEQGRAIEPSPAFKARARAKLTLHMQAHPRKSTRSGFAFWRFATNFAMFVLAFLIAGTAYAQSALPGDLFYEWKLVSEHAWRVVSPDPIRTDLAIANRRIEEINTVADDPVLSALAMQGYQEVLTRLQSELDAETLKQILPQIEIEQEPIENPEQLIPTLPLDLNATAVPLLPLEATATPGPDSMNTPSPDLPEILPTTSAPIISTIPVLPTEPPDIVPTIQIPVTEPPDIIPTIEIPPLLP